MISFSPGDIFPDVQVKTRDGEETSLIPRVTEITGAEADSAWFAVFIYRGKHCPICAKYLNKLQDQLSGFKKINTKVIAVSADSVEQLNEFFDDAISKVEFPVYAGLSIDVMQSMGLYLSEPVSSSETDHIFAEPALFVVNSKREIQLLGGIEFSQNKDYPIRGTCTY